jgi:hypothetical protein
MRFKTGRKWGGAGLFTTTLMVGVALVLTVSPIHLPFAYALSGDPKYVEAARQWVLASCRVWEHEAEGMPHGGKAYASDIGHSCPQQRPRRCNLPVSA